ncbi:unnamed protein product [Camellia sinensis]
MEEWKEVEGEGTTMGDIFEASCFFLFLQTLASLFRSKQFQNPNPAFFLPPYTSNLVQTGLKRRFDFPRKSQRTCGEVNARAEKVNARAGKVNSAKILSFCSFYAPTMYNLIDTQHT